jgi:chromosome segregation ATPase
MTEVERKEKVKEKTRVQTRIYEENLIPELYELYREGKIDWRSADEFICADPEVQRSVLHCLSIERPVVPPELVERHAREIESIEASHSQTLSAEREKLAKAEAEKKKAQEALAQNGKELEEIRKRAKDTLAKYEKNKDQITKQVKKEVEKQIEDLEKERETRETAMKAKQGEIAQLNGEIETLNNRIYGYDSQVALWKHEVARVSELYDKSVAYYSNPALIEVQLQVISEFVESLVRFSKCHMWDAEASRTVTRYRKSISDLLEKLDEQVKSRQKEVVSVQESEKAVAARTEEEATPKAS